MFPRSVGAGSGHGQAPPGSSKAGNILLGAPKTPSSNAVQRPSRNISTIPSSASRPGNLSMSSCASWPLLLTSSNECASASSLGKAPSALASLASSSSSALCSRRRRLAAVARNALLSMPRRAQTAVRRSARRSMQAATPWRYKAARKVEQAGASPRGLNATSSRPRSPKRPRPEPPSGSSARRDAIAAARQSACAAVGT
mmetsp:Transcript_119912/g.346463  ORF Transcript_119912/g.346463 Transcript_119912/m.346463 type:complete len:200 (+) Transcript_119912:1605-2204(+)